MESATHWGRKRIEDVRCPSVERVSEDVYHLLHHSFVDILKMRRSIEGIDAHMDSSATALAESRKLLNRLRAEGF
jgi:hypothetical protein